ncbi:MAG: hypothetical protein AB7L09_02245 [Nitrospira sp.]
MSDTQIFNEVAARLQRMKERVDSNIHHVGDYKILFVNWTWVYDPRNRLVFTTLEHHLVEEPADYWRDVLIPLLDRAMLLDELARIQP